MFTVTETRETSSSVHGSPAAGASFLYEGEAGRAVFHSFKNPAGTWSFTGLVPSSLRGGFDTLQGSINAVLALN